MSHVTSGRSQLKVTNQERKRLFEGASPGARTYHHLDKSAALFSDELGVSHTNTVAKQISHSYTTKGKVLPQSLATDGGKVSIINSTMFRAKKLAITDSANKTYTVDYTTAKKNLATYNKLTDNNYELADNGSLVQTKEDSIDGIDVTQVELITKFDAKLIAVLFGYTLESQITQPVNFTTTSIVTQSNEAHYATFGSLFTGKGEKSSNTVATRAIQTVAQLLGVSNTSKTVIDLRFLRYGLTNTIANDEVTIFKEHSTLMHQAVKNNNSAHNYFGLVANTGSQTLVQQYASNNGMRNMDTEKQLIQALKNHTGSKNPTYDTIVELLNQKLQNNVLSQPHGGIFVATMLILLEALSPNNIVLSMGCKSAKDRTFAVKTVADTLVSIILSSKNPVTTIAEIFDDNGFYSGHRLTTEQKKFIESRISDASLYHRGNVIDSGISTNINSEVAHVFFSKNEEFKKLMKQMRPSIKLTKVSS